MRKRLLSVCIIAIVVFGINGCSRSDADISAIETGNIADDAEREEQTGDSPVLQEESEPDEEMDCNGSNTYLSIRTEYERAWEDEAYTIEEWQDVAGVFKTLTNAKFQLETREKDYELYYSMSDLTGDGIEELIIGIRGEDGTAPCFLYTGNGERIRITDSRTGDDLVEKPTILYENGIVKSTEYVQYIDYRVYRYNFYQLSKDMREMERIDQYF